MKQQMDNKLMLQQLYNFDEKMSIVKETIEERTKQITQMTDEADEYDAKIDAVQFKIDKALKIATSKPKKYRAIKGDSVDEMIANVINIKSCDVPISRCGGGNYIFGTKKIFTKIMNNKLVVRVGGGYMSMDEFIQTHAESERLRIERMDPAEVEKLHMDNSETRRGSTLLPPGSSRGSSPKFSAQKSPKQGSPQRRGSGTFRKI